MTDLPTEERDVVGVSAKTETYNLPRPIDIITVEHDVEIDRKGYILLLAGRQRKRKKGKRRNINVLSHIFPFIALPQ